MDGDDIRKLKPGDRETLINAKDEECEVIVLAYSPPKLIVQIDDKRSSQNGDIMEIHLSL